MAVYPWPPARVARRNVRPLHRVALALSGREQLRLKLSGTNPGWSGRREVNSGGNQRRGA